MSEQKHKGVALITGASSGIGATYAKRLAKRGHDLLLVARDQARLDALAAQLREETGVQVEVLRADLTERADLNRVAQRLRSDAAISVLVNNAGVAINGTLADTDLDRFDAMIQLNVIAVTHLAAAAAANFSAQGRGTLINIASVLALAPELFNGTYSGTKAFVLNLSQSLNKELGDKGVRVQVVLPGATRTEIWERSGTGIENIPQEIIMDVDEMVDAALAGFDQGELVTIPALPDVTDWERFTAARFHMAPNLSLSRAAERYKG
ncbi:SDR family oxidoreductase [Metapseudomonas furukawaii]|uniref:SDR family NAD(P)-dependent oxidoreductase n=1 Tax=Metapseudomonas furukawaii TaxID=1149133 RepID=UPI00227A4BE6|nr:SDR family oxidoreductase [Pseudomonas furukawaii]WAG77520.1 SDR family oxidoreductase [Pseudomonas furukawaii]